MNAQESITSQKIAKATLIVATVAVALCAIGISVIFTWHTPASFGEYRAIVTKMAYNTAICMILSGITLAGLLFRNFLLIKTCALVMATISSLTLLEFILGTGININYWFISEAANNLKGGGLMSPTTATCILLTSISLLLFKNPQTKFIIPIVFLNLISLTITLIALLGYGIGLAPAFVWLGIKMAPHTAMGLSFFSIAIITHIHRTAIDALNRLSFFHRIAIGFGFMAILVVAIGSTAVLQVHTVSAIASPSYSNTTSVEQTEEAKKLVLVIITGFLIVGLTVASLITRSLTFQLTQIRRAMLAITHEKLDYPIPFLDQSQEIGDMARALEVFRDGFATRRELETSLSQVIEAMPNGVVMVSRTGTIEIINTQTEKIFGYNRSELLGKSVELLIPHKISKHHEQNRESFFSSPSPRMMGAGRELFGLHRDGKEFPVEIGLAPVETKEGMKVLASIVDITERRNTNIALNESRERLELTTKINQIGVWEYIVDEGKLIWNDAMFEIYGRNKQYFTADYHAWQQCVHPNDIENAEKLFDESIKNIVPFMCKFRIIQPDGTIKHIHAKAKIERTKTNHLRILGTNIDITREELALAKIHNLEALRSAIVEYSEDAIISKTPTGIVTSWNLGAENIFGYSAQEAVGKHIKNLVIPAELAHEEEILLAQVRTGLVIKHFETSRRCKDGHTISVSITLSPIKDVDGNIIGISSIKRDITDFIETTKMLATRKAELEFSNHALERSNKELGTFAYVASHDLKSPLRGIAQLSTWIEEDLAENKTTAVAEHALLLRNRIQRMEKLLDDLLVFYRAGKSEGTMTEIDASQMATEIFEIQNNKPGLKLEVSNNLPNFTTLSTPFELIIRNLFSNAIKHHDKENGLIKISSRDLDENFFEFSVSDDGPGIPEKFHSRVFGMFQTLKPRDELEGSGMGLALIKKIVETYGGSVNLKSTGRGSCFYFSWPKNIKGRQEND